MGQLKIKRQRCERKKAAICPLPIKLTPQTSAILALKTNPFSASFHPYKSDIVNRKDNIIFKKQALTPR
jgi:hypothetical protein